MLSFDQVERLEKLSRHPAALANLSQLLQGVAHYATQGVSPDTYINMMEMQLDFLAIMRRFKANMLQAQPNGTFHQTVQSISSCAGFALANLTQDDPLPWHDWADALAADAAQGLYAYFSRYAVVQEPPALPACPTHACADTRH